MNLLTKLDEETTIGLLFDNAALVFNCQYITETHHVALLVIFIASNAYVYQAVFLALSRLKVKKSQDANESISIFDLVLGVYGKKIL